MNTSAVQLSASLAHFKLQTLGSMTGAAGDFDAIFASVLGLPFAEQARGSSDLLSAVIQNRAVKPDAMHAGRNMSLPDPESAYKMMTVINNKDVLYKAQFSELNELGAAVSGMQEAGESLAGITAATDNDSIKTGLLDFAERYNDWIHRFADDLRGGGLLAGTQAAEISQYELEQSVKNVFNGIHSGFHGLADLGVTVEPGSRLLSLDGAKLDAALARSKAGVVETVREFSSNFVKSASLLNSEDNFIPNQLDNLNRAIHYISDNGDSLRAEFGTGDAAKPSGKVAQALEAYRRNYGN
ncbi:MAG: flagellar filament capping protein FliD [Actinomycetota bacterium]|nr:flagellar filament capping protein FliD [Actinomycetota bacterium]MDZ4202743.1 flagellar filament capping protein FliD [Gallionella sp.]